MHQKHSAPLNPASHVVPLLFNKVLAADRARKLKVGRVD